MTILFTEHSQTFQTFIERTETDKLTTTSIFSCLYKLTLPLIFHKAKPTSMTSTNWRREHLGIIDITTTYNRVEN